MNPQQTMFAQELLRTITTLITDHGLTPANYRMDLALEVTKAEYNPFYNYEQDAPEPGHWRLDLFVDTYSYGNPTPVRKPFIYSYKDKPLVFYYSGDHAPTVEEFLIHMQQEITNAYGCIANDDRPLLEESTAYDLEISPAQVFEFMKLNGFAPEEPIEKFLSAYYYWQRRLYGSAQFILHLSTCSDHHITEDALTDFLQMTAIVNA